MNKLSAKEKTEIREAIREDDARIKYELMYGNGMKANLKRSHNLRPSVLAARYNVTDGQIQYAIKTVSKRKPDD